MGGQLRASQDEANLWAVAVPDHDVPPLFDHGGDVLGRLVRRDVLVPHGFVHLVLDQRVAADRYDGGPVAHVSVSSSVQRLLVSSASPRQFSVSSSGQRLLVRSASPRQVSVSAITAFWPCRRFSAWSKTTECGPSMTASATSAPRSAGSGCM